MSKAVEARCKPAGKDESFYLRDAGRDLVEHSYLIPEEDARSRSETLFPLIYVTSKKMSFRPISRWLSNEKKIDFNAGSVAKLLQESLFSYRVKPRAEHISAQVGVDPETLLFTSFGEEIIERDLRAQLSRGRIDLLLEPGCVGSP
jgi:hypothetical protein